MFRNYCFKENMNWGKKLECSISTKCGLIYYMLYILNDIYFIYVKYFDKNIIKR